MTGDEEPEVEFTSTVTAREMHFREVPDNQVTFTGYPDHESDSGSERSHLPDAASPHVTYRDVRVDYRIVSKLRTDSIWWWKQQS